MKRIVALFLSTVMMLSFLAMSILPIFAIVSTMELTDAVYPSFLDVGLSYSISGEITSNSNIKSVTVGVYKANGEEVMAKTQTPDAEAYNISMLDSYISFGKLAEGNYIFKVTASDENVDDKVLLAEDLVVGFPNGSVGDKMTDKRFNFIDVSYHQGTVDWSKVKDEVDGVILRLGYRGEEYHNNLAVDSRFLSNYKDASENGIPVGVYFFTLAYNVEEAIEEAKFVVDVLEKNGCKLQLPVYMDMEYTEKTDKKFSRAVYTNMTKAFCEEIKKANYLPGVYCSRYWAQTRMYMSALSDYTTWIAEYDVSACTYQGKYEMWQYTDEGSVNGISGNVDMNICYKDIAEYIRKMNNTDEPEIETADYTKLDAMLALVPDNLNIYTKSSREALQDVVSEADALSRDLTPSQQAVIDELVTKLKNAINGLLLSGGFEKNSDSQLVFDDENNKIYGIPQKTTLTGLTDNHITLKGEATIECENLSKYVTTGTIIKVKINGTTIAQYTVILNGDVDSDGVIDGNDSVILTMLNNGMMSKDNLTSAQYEAADFNKDSKVDEKDNQMIFDHALMK